MILRLCEAIRRATVQFQAVHQRMKVQAEKSWREERFDMINEVILSTKNIYAYTEHLLKKLRRRWLGPFVLLVPFHPWHID